MIRIRDLEKTYAADEVKTTALKNINLDIEEGEFVAVSGPSGCGKTTLLNIIGLLDEPTAGEYFFREKEMFGISEKEKSAFRKHHMGFVFQNYNLIDELTVYENTELPLIYLGISKAERKRLVRAMLDRMKMIHRRNHYPYQLSGGQQQRVAVARAVITKPKLLLADEPTGNLDSEHGEEVMGLLNEFNEAGTTIVIVTHSTFNAGYAGRVIHLFDGQIVTDNLKV